MEVTTGKEPIILAHKDSLLTRAYVHALARRLFEMELSRQRTAQWLAGQLFECERPIVDEYGNALILSDTAIDDAYGNDQSFTWNTNIKRFATVMPKRKPKQMLLPRLRLFDAAFKACGKPIIVS